MVKIYDYTKFGHPKGFLFPEFYDTGCRCRKIGEEKLDFAELSSGANSLFKRITTLSRQALTDLHLISIRNRSP